MSFTPPDWTPGDRIRKIRESRGMTVRQLAETAGLNKGTVVNAESGVRAISDRTLEQLALVLEVPEKWLRHGL